MAYDTTCPSCSHGYTIQEAGDQAKLEARIKAKGDEAKRLAAELERTKRDAGDVGAIRAERDQLRSTIETMKSEAQVSTAYRNAGIPDDDGIRDGFRAIYQSQMADVGEGERTPFSEWLASDAAKNHVLLSPHYSDPGGHAETKGTESGQAGESGQGSEGVEVITRRAPRHLPNTEAGTVNPGTAKHQPKTPEELRAYLRSPEFKSLPREKRREIKTELRGQVGLPPSTLHQDE